MGTNRFLSGILPQLIIMDELTSTANKQVWSLPWRDATPPVPPVFKLETPPHYAATVKVYAIDASRDPRNPNPAAPGWKTFIVVAGEKQIGPAVPSLAIAKVKARGLHKAMIDKIVENGKTMNPGFGRF